MRKRSKRIVIAGLLAIPLVLVGIYFFIPQIPLALALKAQQRAAGVEQKEIQVHGNPIPYLSGGTGEPLILLHGFGGDKNHWVRIAKYLTTHFQVIAPDLPGFGEGNRDPSLRYGISDQVERVHDFAEALHLKSFHLGGNSMGGQIAGAFAARYPQSVKTLWLLAPGGVLSAKRSELGELVKKGENPLLVNNAEDYDRLLDFVFVERPNIPRSIKRYLTQHAIHNRAFNAKVFKEIHEDRQALESVLKGVPVPTLIVWGDHDRLLDVSGAGIVKSAMPNAEVIVMKNTGHAPMIERPEDTATAFLRFQEKVSNK
ncbi:MAG: Alpha/beta hydrolase [Thermodesulfobacteriota bacterium]|nr:Alpha/beta hydrolase [Thermodesulfobacteriota bacterium]